jgi:hypothetical protein
MSRTRAFAILLMMVGTLGLAAGADAASMTLAWNASTSATGYIVMYGTQSQAYTSQVDVGNQVQYTLSGLTNGTTYYFAVEAYDSGGTSGPSAEVSGVAPGTTGPPPVYTSFNGDSFPDLLWQNQSTGQLAEWDMNGVTRTTTNLFNPSSVAPVWSVVGVADFNADGHMDLLWQNTATGQIAVWLMQGTTMLSAVMPTPSAVDVSWKVVGVADFNGDGKPDLLWRSSTTGQIAVWYMQGTTMTSVAIVNPSLPDPTWSIVGIADFNGDGQIDLLWENTVTGLLAVWYMQGITMSSATLLNPNAVPDTTWRVAGVGDFNGDGHPDLFWQNSLSGLIGVWYMNGVNETSVQMFTPATVAPIWRIAAIR